MYDFYKPDLHSEYPEVDGPLSNKCYTKAVDIVYSSYLAKSGLKGLDDLDYVCFHSPYTKLVQKSFGRLLYNDFKRDSGAEKFKDVQAYKDVGVEESFVDRSLEKAFMGLTKADFMKKVTSIF